MLISSYVVQSTKETGNIYAKKVLRLTPATNLLHYYLIQVVLRTSAFANQINEENVVSANFFACLGRGGFKCFEVKSFLS